MQPQSEGSVQPLRVVPRWLKHRHICIHFCSLRISPICTPWPFPSIWNSFSLWCSTQKHNRFGKIWSKSPCDILETGICCLLAQLKWLTVWWILRLNRWNSPELQGRGSPVMNSALCLAWTGVLKALKWNRSSGSLSNASHLSHCQAARVFEMDDIQVVESKPLLEIPVCILKKHRWHSSWGSVLHDRSQLFLFISDVKIQILLQTLTDISF